MTIQPRNLVDWLGTHEPHTLEALRAEHPEAAAMLRRDRELGSRAEPSAPVEAMANLAQAGMDLARKRVDRLLAELSGQMNRARDLKLYGAVTSAISSTGLVASLAKVLSWGADKVQLLLACVTLAGSLLTIFAERAAGGAGGGRAREFFDKAIAASGALLRMDMAWQRDRLGALNGKRIEAVLIQLDAIALQLHEIELRMQVS